MRGQIGIMPLAPQSFMIVRADSNRLAHGTRRGQRTTGNNVHTVMVTRAIRVKIVRSAGTASCGRTADGRTRTRRAHGILTPATIHGRRRA